MLNIGCADTDVDCLHHASLKATHAGRVATDTPIYAVLTQPYTGESEKPDEFGQFLPVYDSPKDALNKTFVKQSHVKFLSAGGARVMPLSYRLDRNQLYNLLEQVNGVYMPGDTGAIL